MAVADLADDVRCQEIRFSQSVESRNAELFATFIDDDARFVGSSVLRGPEAVAAAWSVFFQDAGPRITWRPQFVEVLENGALALTRGPYKLITTDAEGASIEHWGTFNSVWRLQPDGGWKVVFDAGSDAEESPEPEVRALLEQDAGCGE